MAAALCGRNMHGSGMCGSCGDAWCAWVRLFTVLMRLFYRTRAALTPRYTQRSILIKMFARSKNCTCPKCGIVSTHRHGTYDRKLQNIPILGKYTWLFVSASCQDESHLGIKGFIASSTQVQISTNTLSKIVLSLRRKNLL